MKGACTCGQSIHRKINRRAIVHTPRAPKTVAPLAAGLQTKPSTRYPHPPPPCHSVFPTVTPLQLFVGRWAQHQPKGVPLHVRQTFDYFTFTAPAPPKIKEEPTVPKPAGATGTAPAASAFFGDRATGSEAGHVGGNSVDTVSTEISSATALDQVEKVCACVPFAALLCQKRLKLL